jgi:hypothetical protein
VTWSNMYEIQNLMYIYWIIETFTGPYRTQWTHRELPTKVRYTHAFERYHIYKSKTISGKVLNYSYAINESTIFEIVHKYENY